LSFWRGFLLVALVPVGGALGFALLLLLSPSKIGDPSAGVLQSIAAAGVGLLIAYSVGITAIVVRDTVDYDHWLGVCCGIGFSGLVGVVICLVTAAYREAGHAGTFDQIGLAWAVCSIFPLAGFIAFWPAVHHELHVGDKEN
jgi:hypothetical protein